MTDSILKEVAALARRAENWGAGAQGANVVTFGELLVGGDYAGAMKVRDKILADLKSARANRAWCIAGWLSVAALVCSFLGGVALTYLALNR